MQQIIEAEDHLSPIDHDDLLMVKLIDICDLLSLNFAIFLAVSERHKTRAHFSKRQPFSSSH